jgi:hypothetical protein
MTSHPRRLDPIALGLGAAALLAALPVSWPAALHAAWLAAALAIAPGWLVSPLLAPDARTVRRALLALTLSPFLVGAPAAVLVGSGLKVAATARGILIAVALLGLLRALRPGPTSPRGESGRAPIWIAALSWAGLVAALLAMNPWLAPRADGWFHAAVTLQVLERGLPPEDPFFAGLRLLYFWGYHVWTALWLGVAPRLSVWTPMILLNVTASVGVVLGACVIARRLGAGARGIWLTAVLTVFGYAPFSWVLALLRITTGSVTGAEEAQRLLSYGVGPVLTTLNPGTPHVSMVFFGDKFLILTPLALGMAVFAALIVAFLDFVAQPSVRRGVLLALLEGAALFFHSVVGWAGALVAGAWWWWALWRARQPKERGLTRALRSLPVAFAAAALILLPYLAATTLGKQQGVGWGLSLPSLAAWLVAGALLVPPGLIWLATRGRTVGPARELLGVSVILSGGALLIGLPLFNQVKLFNLLFLVLAAPAALGWLALLDRLGTAGRRVLAAVLALAIAPTTALCLWGFVTESGQTLRGWQRPATAAERAGFEWVRDRTASDAVFVDRTLTLDLTVHAGRSTLWGGDEWEKNWGYPRPALALRRRAVAQLGRGDPPSPDVATFLGGLGREVIVVARRIGSADADTLFRRPSRAYPWSGLPPEFEPLYQNPDIAFYRWARERGDAVSGRERMR